MIAYNYANNVSNNDLTIHLKTMHQFRETIHYKAVIVFLLWFMEEKDNN